MLSAHEQFYQDHGAFARDPNDDTIYFVDGASVEGGVSGFAQLIPPSDDDYQRAVCIAKYWELVATHDHRQFEAFKNWLCGGGGTRQDAWAKLYDEAAQIGHLKMLQTQAKRSRAKFLAAKRSVKEHKPYWLDLQEKEDAEEARKKSEFRDRIESFNL